MSDQLIALRSRDALSAPGVTVDKQAGIIRNVSVMSGGEAKGHGFSIDDTMLNQIASQMGAGARMRFTHNLSRDAMGNIMPTESLGKQIGVVKNARVEDGRVRGDIHFGPYARNVPGMGDVAGYLMDLAESDPGAYGLSVVFAPGTPLNRRDAPPLMRSKTVHFADLTDDPAANPAGLLSSHAAAAKPAPVVQPVAATAGRNVTITINRK